MKYDNDLQLTISTSVLKNNYLRKPTPYHSHRKITGKPYKRKEALWIDYKDPNQKEDNTPFRFTGKERDLETGLYYYGARYLDPKTSRWMSADPAMGEYIPTPGQDIGKLSGMGGVFNTVNMHTYHYAANNPVKYVDPDGRITIDGDTIYADLSCFFDMSTAAYAFNMTDETGMNVFSKVVATIPGTGEKLTFSDMAELNNLIKNMPTNTSNVTLKDVLNWVGYSTDAINFIFDVVGSNSGTSLVFKFIGNTMTAYNAKDLFNDDFSNVEKETLAIELMGFAIPGFSILAGTSKLTGHVLAETTIEVMNRMFYDQYSEPLNLMFGEDNTNTILRSLMK